MIKSPLRYPGGKSRAVKLISALIPEFDEFREPFLGGGSVFIYANSIFRIKSFGLTIFILNFISFEK
jgi:DNA adenine methylase